MSNTQGERQPIQPLYTDGSGVVRFKPNQIVRYLLDNGGITMNDLALEEFSAEDRMQFAQLIGYSLSGFGTLSYVSNDVYEAASLMQHRVLDERDSLIQALREKLDTVRDSLRGLVPQVFQIHPDDLVE